MPKMNLNAEEIDRIVRRVFEKLSAAPRGPDAGALEGSVALGAPKITFPEVMTIEQLAEYLQLHPQVLYRHVRKGNIPASHIGKTIRFKRSVIDRWLESDARRSVGAAGDDE